MELQRNTVRNILHFGFNDLVGDSDFPKIAIVADDSYDTVEPDWVLNSILTDPILSPKRYVKNVFDCDDYVMYLKTKMSLFAQTNKQSNPLALGFIMTSRHAFNFCIDTNSKLHLINTQSDNKDITNDVALFETFLGLSGANSIRLIYV